MGGGQSQEETVVTVETAEGEAEVTVTQSFLNYVTGQEDETKQTSQSNDETTPNSKDHGGYSRRPPSAEELLLGNKYSDDNQWRRLYEEEKEKNNEYKTITTEGFETAANQVKKQFIDSKLGKLVPVCEENRERVQKCYHDNPNKILNCSTIVREYTQCVKNARKGLLIQTLNNENTN